MNVPVLPRSVLSTAAPERQRPSRSLLVLCVVLCVSCGGPDLRLDDEPLSGKGETLTCNFTWQFWKDGTGTITIRGDAALKDDGHVTRHSVPGKYPQNIAKKQATLTAKSVAIAVGAKASATFTATTLRLYLSPITELGSLHPETKQRWHYTKTYEARADSGDALGASVTLKGFGTFTLALPGKGIAPFEIDRQKMVHQRPQSTPAPSLQLDVADASDVVKNKVAGSWTLASFAFGPGCKE